jgi:hypothetical protein
MPIMKQLTVALENKPAQLSRLSAALSRAKINIVALTVLDSVEASLVRLVPDNAATAKRLIKKLNLPCTAKRVLVYKMSAGSGTMARATRRLAKAGINVDYVYGSEPAGEGHGLIVFGVKDPKKAEAVLKGE